MAGPTSNSLATAMLLLLPLDVLTAVSRFRIRLVKRVRGSDDWAMLISIVCFCNAQISAEQSC